MGYGIARMSALAWSVKATRLAIRLALLTRKGSFGQGFPIHHRQAKIAENRFQRNRRVVLAPRISFGDGAAVFFAKRLIVDRSPRELLRRCSWCLP